MAKMAKSLSLCLVAILAISWLIMVESASGQSIPKPSVPEFTITIDDNSYYQPATTPTYYTDPYTGEKHILTEGQDGYPVQNGTINLTIHTQKFDNYFDSENHFIKFYLRVAYKGHFEPSWNYYPLNYGYYGNDSQYFEANPDGVSKARFGFGHFSFVTGEYRSISTPPSLGEIKKGGQVDFKVEALIGYRNASEYNTIWGPMTFFAYIGESSGWSNTQTITLADGSVSVSSSPNPSSTNSQSSITPTLPPDTFFDDSTVILFSIIVAILVISVISLLLYVRHLKGRKPQN